MKTRNVFEAAAIALIADSIADRPDEVLREGMHRLAALAGNDPGRIEGAHEMLATARDKLLELARAGDSSKLRHELEQIETDFRRRFGLSRPIREEENIQCLMKSKV